MNVEKARKSLANNVLNFRIKNDMSIIDLSRATNVSTRTLRRIELADEIEYNAGMDKVLRISKATKIPVSKLLGQRVVIASA